MILRAIVGFFKFIINAIAKVVAWLLVALGLWLPAIFCVLFFIFCAITGTQFQSISTLFYAGLIITTVLSMWFTLSGGKNKQKNKKPATTPTYLSKIKEKSDRVELTTATPPNGSVFRQPVERQMDSASDDQPPAVQKRDYYSLKQEHYNQYGTPVQRQQHDYYNPNQARQADYHDPRPQRQTVDYREGTRDYRDQRDYQYGDGRGYQTSYDNRQNYQPYDNRQPYDNYQPYDNRQGYNPSYQSREYGRDFDRREGANAEERARSNGRFEDEYYRGEADNPYGFSPYKKVTPEPYQDYAQSEPQRTPQRNESPRIFLSRRDSELLIYEYTDRLEYYRKTPRGLIHQTTRYKNN